MCRLCDEGRALDQVLHVYRRRIHRHGWAVAHQPGEAGRAGLSYTLGLTRLHGHPEVLVTGQPQDAASGLLKVLSVAVRGGLWLEAGFMFPAEGGVQVQLAWVDDPRTLWHAQEIYAGPAGPVPALQAIWSDHRGNWPWSPGWPGTAADQPLFGSPVHQ